MTQHEIETRLTCYAEELREIQGRLMALFEFIPEDEPVKRKVAISSATVGSAASMLQISDVRRGQM